MADRGSSGGGIGFVGLLTIVFVTLKLLDKIDWSWWWVLSPIWIATCGVTVILVFAAVIMLIAFLREEKARGRIR